MPTSLKIAWVNQLETTMAEVHMASITCSGVSAPQRSNRPGRECLDRRFRWRLHSQAGLFGGQLAGTAEGDVADLAKLKQSILHDFEAEEQDH